MINELMSTNHVRVDVSLWAYNDTTGVFEDTVMLATNLPNSGSVSIPLPESAYLIQITMFVLQF